MKARRVGGAARGLVPLCAAAGVAPVRGAPAVLPAALPLSGPCSAVVRTSPFRLRRWRCVTTVKPSVMVSAGVAATVVPDTASAGARAEAVGCVAGECVWSGLFSVRRSSATGGGVAPSPATTVSPVSSWCSVVRKVVRLSSSVCRYCVAVPTW
ncbi:hypothetical protein PF010_g19393 [Phytophthora fragariae]|uniref:Uncharacterized protein n=1 Tax=Phytophthora fragariae TaxID=53985 RepID=A0A6A3JD51_9STRA|nr:hypothetical protein PF011_g18746 [Phytophthora fragariae]KAE9088397.1 hypothetical protein PF010_g19393 [Phytophthora fragariae]KAE9191357.1 hypothetical protein PF004_g21623 [Phytophthora fragariae]